MKHRAIYVAITIITLCVFSISSLGWSFQPGGQPQLQQNPGKDARRRGPGRNRGERGMRINWEELGLSEEQQEQMQQLNREFRVNTAEIREELKFAEKDLRAEMTKETVDRTKIDSILSDIAALKQKLSEARTQKMLAMKGILTQEQFEKLSNLRQRLPRELRGIELTVDQRSQIGTIMKNSKKKSRTLREELRDSKEQFQEILLASGDPDSASLQQLQTDIAAKEAALKKDQVDMFLQIKELLTPEQQKQLQQPQQSKRGKGVARARR